VRAELSVRENLGGRGKERRNMGGRLFGAITSLPPFLAYACHAVVYHPNA